MLPLHKLKSKAGPKEIFHIKLSSAEDGILYEHFTNFSRVFTDFSRVLKRKACKENTTAEKPANTDKYSVYGLFPLASPTGLRLAPLACTLRLSQSAFAMLGFLEPQCRTGSRPVQSSPLYTKKEEDHPSDLLPFGSSNWTRTSDTLINSQVLYRLSYGGIFNLQPPWAASL